jgi:hypothetical protein
VQAQVVSLGIATIRLLIKENAMRIHAARGPATHLSFTRHAAVRMQQRGIPSWFLDLLVRHGKSRHDGHGAIVVSVCKDTRRKLQSVLTRIEYAEAERFFGVYAVLSADDAIVTAAHRTHRRFQ